MKSMYCSAVIVHFLFYSITLWRESVWGLKQMCFVWEVQSVYRQVLYLTHSYHSEQSHKGSEMITRAQNKVTKDLRWWHELDAGDIGFYVLDSWELSLWCPMITRYFMTFRQCHRIMINPMVKPILFQWHCIIINWCIHMNIMTSIND